MCEEVIKMGYAGALSYQVTMVHFLRFVLNCWTFIVTL